MHIRIYNISNFVLSLWRISLSRIQVHSADVYFNIPRCAENIWQLIAASLLAEGGEAQQTQNVQPMLVQW